jgi:hypothetical protein
MFTRRLVTLVRVCVVAAGVVTALTIGAVASLQLGFWLIMKTWSPFPISRLIELVGVDVPRRYVPASIESADIHRVDAQDIVEWLLNVPAIVALFIALAVLSLLYASLASAERRWAPVSGPDDEPPASPGPA